MDNFILHHLTKTSLFSMFFNWLLTVLLTFKNYQKKKVIKSSLSFYGFQQFVVVVGSLKYSNKIYYVVKWTIYRFPKWPFPFSFLLLSFSLFISAFLKTQFKFNFALYLHRYPTEVSFTATNLCWIQFCNIHKPQI